MGQKATMSYSAKIDSNTLKKNRRRYLKAKIVCNCLVLIACLAFFLWCVASFVEVNYKNDILVDRGAISEYNLFSIMTNHNK